MSMAHGSSVGLGAILEWEILSPTLFSWEGNRQILFQLTMVFITHTAMSCGHFLTSWLLFWFVYSSFNILQFLFLFQNFSWNIVVLQYCVSFSYAAKWISYTYACISSFSRFLSGLGNRRILSRAPCVIQQVPVSCLFYTKYQ